MTRLFSACARVAIALSWLACSSTTNSGFGDSGASGSGTGTVFNPGSGTGSSGTGSGTGMMLGGGGTEAGTGTGCASTDPNADLDKDGWTPMQGDCNDCDPNVNPGAIDVLHSVDGGMPVWGDEDCSGKPGDSAEPCDTGLALTDTSAGDGAKAIELCAVATATDRRYGVISANYVRADGTAYPSPTLQVGIESSFGANVHPQGGQNMLALSTGYARAVGQPNACNKVTCVTNASGNPPTGFPQTDTCPPTPKIADDIALELQVRVPTNATGYSFNFKFYSFEFPEYVCDPKGYNDQFVALVTPAPMGSFVPAGSTAGNISFDMNHHPVSVNLGFFDVCDGNMSRFASSCKSGSGSASCPPVPSPYCPLGVSELAGTGFDVWQTHGPAGATRWLTSQAPATPGSTITLRFAIWDAGNDEYDSTVLIDHVSWIASGAVPVMTAPTPLPK